MSVNTIDTVLAAHAEGYTAEEIAAAITGLTPEWVQAVIDGRIVE